MKRTVRTLAAVLLGISMIRPYTGHAEGEIDTAGIVFDFNQDGRTDQKDWEELREFAKSYRMEGDEEDETFFAKQEVPATIAFLISDYYGSRQSEGYDIDVSSVPEYYLPSLGLTTVVKDQNPFGTCWAFGTLSAIESNLLMQRNNAGETLDPKGYEMDLKNASEEIDLSELYLAYRAFSEGSGSQAGEGTIPNPDEEEKDNPNLRFDLGGFASSSNQLTTSWDGILTEEQEPYEPVKADQDGAVIYDLHNGEETDTAAVPPVHVQKFVYLSSPDILKPDLENKVYTWGGRDEKAVEIMKQAMVKYGALMLGYAADVSRPGEEGTGEYTNYEHWAQYDDRDEMYMNHMVTIVGWNDNFPKENFQALENSIPPGDGAFLIKNSWGNYDTNFKAYGEAMVKALEKAKGTEIETAMNRSYNFGIPDENGHGTGYFWLSYYDHSIVDVCALVADDGADGFDYDNIYQYDLSRQFSAEQSVLPTDNEETKVANVFTAEGNEKLEAVSVYAPQAGCQAEITVYGLNDEEPGPESGMILAQQTVSLSEKGFHTIALDTPVYLYQGMKFAVAEKVITEHDGKKISWLNLENTVLPELQTKDNIGSLRTITVSNPGESYAYVKTAGGHAWTDIETLNKETDAAKVFTFGNAMIKAYTTGGTEVLDGPGTTDPSHVQDMGPIYILGAVLVMMILYLYIRNRNSDI